MKYKAIFEKISKDILLDLASFRVQLIYAAYIYNLILLWAVLYHGLDWRVIHIGLGLLMTVYYHYFKSKASENAAKAVDQDPPTERDPDAIKE